MTWSQHGPHLSPHSAVTVATPHFTRALFLPDASVTQPGLRPASVRPHPRHPPSRSRGRLMFSVSRSLFLCWGLFRTARLMGSQALMGAGLTSLPYRPPPPPVVVQSCLCPSPCWGTFGLKCVRFAEERRHPPLQSGCGVPAVLGSGTLPCAAPAAGRPGCGHSRPQPLCRARIRLSELFSFGTTSHPPS